MCHDSHFDPRTRLAVSSCERRRARSVCFGTRDRQLLLLACVVFLSIFAGSYRRRYDTGQQSTRAQHFVERSCAHQDTIGTWQHTDTQIDSDSRGVRVVAKEFYDRQSGKRVTVEIIRGDLILDPVRLRYS